MAQKQVKILIFTLYISIIVFTKYQKGSEIQKSQNSGIAAEDPEYSRILFH